MTAIADPGPVFAALADPTRRSVLTRLASGGSASATALARELPVTRQAVVQHLAVLDAAARAAASPCGTPREERVHDVAEAEAGTEALVRTAVGVTAHVVLAALRLVGEDVVGLRDPLELLLRLGAGVDVRVQGAGELEVRPLDLLGRGLAADAQILVVVVHA